MRLKSAIWVSAYLRRLQGEGIFAAVRRRGAEEAGAVFIKLALLDGTATLFAPAPQTSYDDAQPSDRAFVASTAQPVEEQTVEARLRREIDFDPDTAELTPNDLEAVLSDLAKQRAYRNVLDLGCGTGLLAIGAAMLWKRRVLASDIDVVAVEVTRENARANGVGSLITAVTADGLTSPLLARGAPYDLIIANILAGPLTQLAPAIQRVLQPVLLADRHIGVDADQDLGHGVMPSSRPWSSA